MRAKYVTIEVASARGIAARWHRERHRDGGGWMRDMDAEIHLKLCELGETPSIQQAAEIIGNKSWTYISCDGCNDYVERGVRIGEWGEGKVYCTTCISEACQVLMGEAK